MLQRLKRKNSLIILAGLATVFLLTFFFIYSYSSVFEQKATDNLFDFEKNNYFNNKKLPDFSRIKDVKLKKQSFFAYLHPMVKAENERLLLLRKKIIFLQKQSVLTELDKQYLLKIANSFKIVNSDDMFDIKLFKELLNRVDIIPASLALAQAANESAWGTSRFAKEANNLFGQWCFSKGCGLVPKSRNRGKTHEVAKFSSINSAVVSYIRNINSGKAYSQLRNIRSELRRKNKPIDAFELAYGLKSYSERGEDYVNEIQEMIRFNKLSHYDEI